MPRAKKYSRPRLSSGRWPRGFSARYLTDAEASSALRPLRDHAETPFDNAEVVKKIEKAINDYRAALMRTKAGQRLLRPKQEKREAQKIAMHARGLERALTTASSETIKRIAQALDTVGEEKERAKWRKILKKEYPLELHLIASAADYGVARAERHARRGVKTGPLQALVVDLVRIWVNTTGKSFVASRQDTNKVSNSLTASSRKFVDYLLYDILQVKKDAEGAFAKRLDWLMTRARAVVSRNLDKTGTESDKSGSDRFSDDGEGDP